MEPADKKLPMKRPAAAMNNESVARASNASKPTLSWMQHDEDPKESGTMKEDDEVTLILGQTTPPEDSLSPIGVNADPLHETDKKDGHDKKDKPDLK